jgi:hypothetical protein
VTVIRASIMERATRNTTATIATVDSHHSKVFTIFYFFGSIVIIKFFL